MLSCAKEDNKVCSDYNLDFLYSIAYPVDSSYVLVEFSNASNNIPANSQTDWEINGDNEGYWTSNSTRFTENGNFSITMISYHNGLMCSVSKEFEINGIK